MINVSHFDPNLFQNTYHAAAAIQTISIVTYVILTVLSNKTWCTFARVIPFRASFARAPVRARFLSATEIYIWNKGKQLYP